MRIAWFENAARWPGNGLSKRVRTLMTHVHRVYSTDKADRIPTATGSQQPIDSFLDEALSCGIESDEGEETVTEVESYFKNTCPTTDNDPLQWWKVRMYFMCFVNRR